MKQNPPKGVLGSVVIDVVEEIALESLVHMSSILKKRPKKFQSEQEAIDWALATGTVRNKKSAQISVPTQLMKNTDGFYYWRTNLEASCIYWVDWFTNLSAKFLAMKGARLLVLAGNDRLDKPLLIGQMQGKFQLEVINSGHCVHEDQPDILAECLVGFYKRNQPLDISSIRKVPK
jgi:pimeloyl-ACP methyl ester carboxylesterase